MAVPRRTKRSRKQEQRGADRLGGRVTPGSGNGWITKNDVKTDDLSVEYKTTKNKSFSLKHEDLKKAERHALMDSGRTAVFIIEFDNEGSKQEYAVLHRGDFEAMLSSDRELRLLQRCHGCQQHLPLTKEYWYNRKTRPFDTYCKACRRTKARDWLRDNSEKYQERLQRVKSERRAFVDELKENTPCADCGGSFPAVAMDFDHGEDEEKISDVSAMVFGSFERLMAEIEKCEIVCANCHRIRTRDRTRRGHS